MAAYWKSPYKEQAQSFRQPNHSTLKFEQSLHLSRAKTSFTTSNRYDWFEFTPRSSLEKQVSPRFLQRSHTTIKGILKTRKRNESSSHGRDIDTDTSDESTTAVNTDSSKKDTKKRVTFGIDVNGNQNDENKHITLPKNLKCPSTTLKRISHSRQIEESALKKLNKLMGGVLEGSSLPSVKGKGLSPRPSHEKTAKPLCNHSDDLKCIRCIRKDVENGNNETFLGNQHADVKFLLKGNQTFVSKEDKENQNQNSACESNPSEAIGEPHIETRSNTFVDYFASSQPEVPKHKPSSVGNSASNNAKKYFRMLPGRYPFNSGAIQVKKLSTPLRLEGEKDNKVSSKEEINVIDLNKINFYSKQNTNLDLKRGLTQHKMATGAENKNQSDSINRIPVLVSPSHADSKARHKEGHSSVSPRAPEPNLDSKQGLMSSDKASHIMDWLNDVHQKQTFRPSHLVAPNQPLETQQLC